MARPQAACSRITIFRFRQMGLQRARKGSSLLCCVRQGFEPEEGKSSCTALTAFSRVGLHSPYQARLLLQRFALGAELGSAAGMRMSLAIRFPARPAPPPQGPKVGD